MRHSDREIKDFNEIVSVFSECDTVRIGIFGSEYPYVVPVSYGYENLNGKIAVYFHGAKEGLKHELIAANPKVCVEADIFKGYINKGTATTADYISAIGYGIAEAVEGNEAVKGINLIMKHCGYDNYDGSKCIKMGITKIYRIILESVTGKKRF